MRIAALLTAGAIGTCALADIVAVEIQFFEYTPSPLTVAAGTTVRWVNLDAIIHTVTSQTGPGTLVPSGLFDSGDMGLDDTFEFTFQQVGTVEYYCIPHGSSMQGRVIVVPPPPCPADVNGDRTINLSDLARLLASFGASSGDPAFDPAADIDDGGAIDLVDLSELLTVFGEDCP